MQTKFYKFFRSCVAILTLLFFMLSFSSCKKEGCIDKDALNYDSKAKKDDGSCEFSASVVFWIDEKGQTFLDDQNAFILTFFFNDKIKGIKFANSLEVKEKAPSCRADGAITFTQFLGNDKTYFGLYSVINEAGDIIFAGPLFLNANQCRKVRLGFF
jgi:hypothetical protein